MQKFAPLVILGSVALTGCQVENSDSQTQDLDGVWQGVFSNANEHQALQAHMLDGLMLSVDLDSEQANSAELVLDDGKLAGIFAKRAAAGERADDYTVLGHALPYDRIQADLSSAEEEAQLSLFYAEAQSFVGASYSDIEGLYAYSGNGIELSLSIDEYGHIEGYDNAGCAYWGEVEVPDYQRNVYAVSLSVDGCALAGEYGYGLGSLQHEVYGWDVLVLPIWFDEQDRVEAWRLERI